MCVPHDAVLHAEFAIVDEAYPYVAQRLLTDDSPRLQEALRYMVPPPPPPPGRSSHPCALSPALWSPLDASVHEMPITVQVVASSICNTIAKMVVATAGHGGAKATARSIKQAAGIRLLFLQSYELMPLLAPVLIDCECGLPPPCTAPVAAGTADGWGWWGAQIYGKEQLFDAERVVDLLQALETFSVASASAQGDRASAAAPSGAPGWRPRPSASSPPPASGSRALRALPLASHALPLQPLFLGSGPPIICWVWEAALPSSAVIRKQPSHQCISATVQSRLQRPGNHQRTSHNVRAPLLAELLPRLRQ